MYNKDLLINNESDSVSKTEIPLTRLQFNIDITLETFEAKEFENNILEIMMKYNKSANKFIKL